MKKNFIWILNTALLVVFIVVCSLLYNNLSGQYKGSVEQSETELRPAPDFTVMDMDGNNVSLSGFAGEPVVINFWATWCYYCKEEMPDFDEASRLYPDVQFMMVNATDGDRETVEIAKNYLKESGFGYFDVYFDTNLDAVSKYKVTGFPATIFVDRDGKIAARANGMIDMETLKRGINLIN